MRVERGTGWELRLGDYREVLADVRCDAVISDPPYSSVTHDKHGMGAAAGVTSRDKKLNAITYASWGAEEVGDFCRFCKRADAGWVAAFSDHNLYRFYMDGLEALGYLAFAPLAQVTINRTVRLTGDGPSNWTCWITVARKRCAPFTKWGALAGAYVDDVGMRKQGVVVGAKQLHTMQAVVRDYSRRGDLVCDPCAGGATTLLAAVMEGRRAIGAEIDEGTFEKAVKRLRGGYTTDLFAEQEAA